MKYSFYRNKWVAISIALMTVSGASIAGVAHYRQIHREGQAISRYAVHAKMRSPVDSRRYVGWLSRNGFDVAGVNVHKGFIEVVTSDAGIEFLNQHGIQGHVIARHDPRAQQADQAPIDPRYMTPEKMEAALKALNAQYPKLTRLEKIGTSTEGRPILALLVSTTPGRQDRAYFEKPSIIFDGLHHAREIMTPEIVFDVAQTILGASSRVRQAQQLIENWNIWIVPMLNVDGNNIVWTRDHWWRKNARTENGTVFGVDINRNYPYRWSQCNGSSSSKTSDIYHGPAAASEPETQALMNLARMVQPTASLSYHSYSEFVLYPYGCQGDVSGENALNEKIGHELAALLPSDSGRGTYTPGTPWELLYSVDGDSMGYMHAEYGALSFTFEVNEEFQPDYSLRQPTLEKHRKAWQYFFDRMQKNMLAMRIVDGKTSQPTQALIDISTIPHVKGEKPFRTNPNGNFFKVLEPGNYTIHVALADGRNLTQQVTMKGGHPEPVVVTVP